VSQRNTIYFNKKIHGCPARPVRGNKTVQSGPRAWKKLVSSPATVRKLERFRTARLPFFAGPGWQAGLL